MTFKTIPGAVRPMTKRELRAISPMSEPPKSRFGLYVGASAALAIAGFAMSAKKGNAETEANVGILCSEHGGLELVDKDEGRVTFRTTIVGESVKDVELAARFGSPLAYLIDGSYAREYQSGTVTFKTGESGLVPDRYEVKGSRFSLTRSVSLKDVVREIPSCADDLNNKIRTALSVAKRRVELAMENVDHRHQDR